MAVPPQQRRRCRERRLVECRGRGTGTPREDAGAWGLASESCRLLNGSFLVCAAPSLVFFRGTPPLAAASAAAAKHGAPSPGRAARGGISQPAGGSRSSPRRSPAGRAELAAGKHESTRGGALSAQAALHEAALRKEQRKRQREEDNSQWEETLLTRPKLPSKPVVVENQIDADELLARQLQQEMSGVRKRSRAQPDYKV
eukprot:COSAG01_NODE_4515_length_4962_cov_3.378573_2_plen_200_part_00